MLKRIFLPLVALLVLSLARAEPPRSAKQTENRAATQNQEKWSVEDVVTTETASEFRIAPNGRCAVWTKSVPDKDKGEPITQLLRTNLRSGDEIELTRGAESCHHPRWSPDGKRLAFLSARQATKPKGDKKALATGDDEARTQIWLMDPFGGEPWPLTEFTRDVTTFEWAGPETLVFLAQEEPTWRESALKDEKKDATLVVEDEQHEPPARLFRVEVEEKKISRLTENADRIESLAVSPDGRRAVTAHSHSLAYTYDNKVKPVLLLYDLETGKASPVFTDPKLNIQRVYWAADGKGFYAVNLFSSQPNLAMAGVFEVFYQDLATSAVSRVDLGWANGLATQDDDDEDPAFVVAKDGFLALLADGARNKIARFSRDGNTWKRAWVEGEHAGHVYALRAGGDGTTVVYAHSTASTPTQWYHARLDGQRLGKPTPLAVLNDHLKGRTRARTEVVRWKGARDEEVEGILYFPHGYQRDRKYPLVVMIHGGPAAADLDAWGETWSYAPNLYCQRGAFVLKPNYHGSSNYGLKWVEAIAAGNYLDLETRDVENGVDSLIGRGLVDPKKLGILGWSNGAILTNVLTTRTTRYKAAAAGAGSVEYVSDWANCEFGEAFDRFYFGKSPLEDPQLYFKKSPFFNLDKVRTPTLIFFGTEDRTVPTHQGWVHFRGLQQLGKAPVRLVLFPGEKHGLHKLGHQRRKLEEELGWFDRHLFQTAAAADESLKEDSPLAWALKRKAARKDGGRFGVLEKGVLVPETVAYQELLLGRFEVTRAQYVQFDPKHAVEPGRDNYPANGITLEQARSYCTWLSITTGRKYRLPMAEEGKALYEEREADDNTLDHWAGYTVNPEDAARLRDKVKELGPGALLREAGGSRGVGRDDLVFDLGGNVAEWVQEGGGTGRLMGGSADTPADAKNGQSKAGPDYRGFRVVLDKGE